MGIWKSFDELEESISLQELDFIIKEKREQEKYQRYFLASLQGIDLSKHEQSEVNDTYEEVKRRAQARLAGGEDELERQELADLGFGFKTV